MRTVILTLLMVLTIVVANLAHAESTVNAAVAEVRAACESAYPDVARAKTIAELETLPIDSVAVLACAYPLIYNNLLQIKTRLAEKHHIQPLIQQSLAAFAFNASLDWDLGDDEKSFSQGVVELIILSQTASQSARALNYFSDRLHIRPALIKINSFNFWNSTLSNLDYLSKAPVASDQFRPQMIIRNSLIRLLKNPVFFDFFRKKEFKTKIKNSGVIEKAFKFFETQFQGTFSGVITTNFEMFFSPRELNHHYLQLQKSSKVSIYNLLGFQLFRTNELLKRNEKVNLEKTTSIDLYMTGKGCEETTSRLGTVKNFKAQQCNPLSGLVPPLIETYNLVALPSGSFGQPSLSLEVKQTLQSVYEKETLEAHAVLAALLAQENNNKSEEELKAAREKTFLYHTLRQMDQSYDVSLRILYDLTVKESDLVEKYGYEEYRKSVVRDIQKLATKLSPAEEESSNQITNAILKSFESIFKEGESL